MEAPPILSLSGMPPEVLFHITQVFGENLPAFRGAEKRTTFAYETRMADNNRVLETRLPLVKRRALKKFSGTEIDRFKKIMNSFHSEAQAFDCDEVPPADVPRFNWESENSLRFSAKVGEKRKHLMTEGKEKFVKEVARKINTDIVEFAPPEQPMQVGHAWQRITDQAEFDLMKEYQVNGNVYIPQLINAMMQLEKLTIYNNSYIQVLPELSLLYHLKTLCLSDLDFLEDLSASFGSLVCLKELYLTNLNRLKRLPESAKKLFNLRVVCIWNVPKLESLSPLEACNQLTRLEIRHADIQKLWSSLFEIDQLEKLVIEFRTNPAWIPDDIGRLSNLEALNLSNNEFTTLPLALGKLTKLTSLDLSMNSLKELPSTIVNLKKLITIILKNNLFSTYPTQLRECHSISTIDLSNNKLTKDPSCRLIPGPNEGVVLLSGNWKPCYVIMY